MSKASTSKAPKQGDLYSASSEAERPSKTIRIAPTGDVLLTKLEMAIVDTPEFQRLRKYRQLGTSYLVYPTALHTRFDHSLGVLNMVERMINSIRNNLHMELEERKITEEEWAIARLVALLHDIANLPFGHTLEDETGVVKSSQDDRSRFDAVIGDNTVIGNLIKDNIGQAGHQRLLTILGAKKEPLPPKNRMPGVTYVTDLGSDAFIFDLVKNTVCADLLDYLHRDTYFCGLSLAVPDRFLKYLHIVKEDNCKRIVIKLAKVGDRHPRAALISELVQLLEIRYFLVERVYFHHAKQIASAMIASSVQAALDDGLIKESDLAGFGDDELLAHLASHRGSLAGELAQAVLDRRLYKRLYEADRYLLETDHGTNHLEILDSTYHKDTAKRKKMELLLAERAGLQPGDVLIYCPDPEMNLKMAEMLVHWRGDNIRLQDVNDDLIRSKIGSIQTSHKNLWALQVFVKKEVLFSPEKRVLLESWCDAEFRRKDDFVRRAMRSTFEDVLRNEDVEHRVTDIDSMVEEALVDQRGRGEETAKFTREYAAKTIKARLKN